MADSPHSALTIGLLIHNLLGMYQATILSGVADYVREQGANFICFPGGEIDAPQHAYRKRNILYDFINDQNVDGLIILSGVMGNFVSIDRIQDFCRHFYPLPMVSVTVALEGIPSVLIDNRAGMRQVLNHLINDHSYRRIAFIQGMETNGEAVQRYRTYLEVLAENNIPFDSDLVTPGDFSSASGMDAIHTLVDERRVRFDAVVAVNDQMALGAMQALLSRKIYVPDDVAVVGFDDIEDANFAISPLTTVRQPIYEQGRQAARLLFQQLIKQPVPDQITLPTELVIRQSCGCMSQTVLEAAVEEVVATNESVETVLTMQRNVILSAMAKAADVPVQGITMLDIQILFEAFSVEFKNKSSGVFLKVVDRTVHKVGLEGGDASGLQKALSVLRRHILPCFVQNGPALLRIENLWQQSRVLIEEDIQQIQSYNIFQVKQRARDLSENAGAMISSRTVEELSNVIAHNFPQLGIDAFYLVLYEGPQHPPDCFKLIMAYDHTGRLALEPGGKSFPIAQWLPDDTLPSDKQHQLLVEPLFFKEAQLGFVIFEMSRHESLLYEDLTKQLSSTLWTVLTSEEQIKVAKELRELNKIKTEFLSTAAHELRTPLTSIQGFSEILLMRDFDQERQKYYLTLINQQSTQLSTIISDLLDITRLENKRKLEFALEPVNIAELISVVVRTMQETSPKHTIQVHGLENCPALMTDPFRLTQVISNLLSNAIKYSPDGGQITVRVEVLSNVLQISVEDQGIGLTPDQQSHLFEKFYRANASNTAINGTGLGLSIAKLIIELLGGEIGVKSKYGVGTTFYFTLPLSSQKP